MTSSATLNLTLGSNGIHPPGRRVAHASFVAIPIVGCRAGAEVKAVVHGGA
jgi:hypothetical protein